MVQAELLKAKEAKEQAVAETKQKEVAEGLSFCNRIDPSLVA